MKWKEVVKSAGKKDGDKKLKCYIYSQIKKKDETDKLGER
jgi:hypothetical protein